MNERIEKLSDEAYDYARERNSIHSPELLRTYTKQFAELIVKECVQMFAENGFDESCDMLIEHWDMDPRTFRS